MPPESNITTHASIDPEWQVYKFQFDRNLREASIRDLDDDALIMTLPRQDRDVESFQLHRNSLFSLELSSYLRYLQTCHILLNLEYPEIVHLSDTNTAEFEEDWDREGTFRYHTLLFHLPNSQHANPYVGFSFIDEQLYSAIYLEIEELS